LLIVSTSGFRHGKNFLFHDDVARRKWWLFFELSDVEDQVSVCGVPLLSNLRLLKLRRLGWNANHGVLDLNILLTGNPRSVDDSVILSGM
jgi:hypothetical protein